jgi:hypothetical protein
MSMKNSSDIMGNRTRDVPSCSAVPQPTAPPGAPQHLCIAVILNTNSCLDIVHPVQYNKVIIMKNQLFVHKIMFNLKTNEAGFI